MFRSIVESYADPAFIVDTKGRVIAWNRAMADLTGSCAEEMTGLSREAVACKLYGYPHALLIDFFGQPPDRPALAYGRSTAGTDDLSGETCITVPRTGVSRLYACKASRLYGPSGEVLGFAETLRDVTDLRKAAEGPVDVCREIHHQVKNNLQIISSLQSLHSMKIRDQGTRSVFRECQERIRAMAMIYERAYLSDRLSEINFSAYVRDMAGLQASTIDARSGRVLCMVDTSPLVLNVEQAVPCGLLLNELIVNALKYAFPGERNGEIHVTIAARNGEVCLKVADNGIGLPSRECWESPQTLGFQLVHALADQMGGRVSMHICNGTSFEIVFPAGRVNI